jgi:hypothetical protein
VYVSADKEREREKERRSMREGEESRDAYTVFVGNPAPLLSLPIAVSGNTNDFHSVSSVGCGLFAPALGTKIKTNIK